MAVPANPDFPPQRFTGRYHVGFETDLQWLGWSPQVWEFLWRPVENFILCNPYLASHEIVDGGGSRFLLTEEAGFLDVPPLVVYFKPDEETRRIAFFTVEVDPLAERA